MRFKLIWVPVGLTLLLIGGIAGAVIFGTKGNHAEADAPPLWWRKQNPSPIPTLAPSPTVAIPTQPIYAGEVFNKVTAVNSWSEIVFMPSEDGEFFSPINGQVRYNEQGCYLIDGKEETYQFCGNIKPNFKEGDVQAYESIGQFMKAEPIRISVWTSSKPETLSKEIVTVIFK